MQMRKKLYIFKHFAKSKKLFFCLYLSFSVWFPLSLKHWSPLMHSCSFSEIFFGYSCRTQAAADQVYNNNAGQWTGPQMTYCSVFNCSNSSKVGNVTFHKFPTGERRAICIQFVGREDSWTPKPGSSICSGHFSLLCKMFLFCCRSSLFDINLDHQEPVKVWRNRHI